MTLGLYTVSKPSQPGSEFPTEPEDRPSFSVDADRGVSDLLALATTPSSRPSWGQVSDVEVHAPIGDRDDNEATLIESSNAKRERRSPANSQSANARSGLRNSAASLRSSSFDSAALAVKSSDVRAGSNLPAGTAVGEYVIRERVGAGGMGVIYAAEHPVLGRKAAVKVLHADLAADKSLSARFLEEARTVSRIGHPNIVDAFSFGVLPDGRPYFVMEWLRGLDLSKRMRKGGLTSKEIFQLFDQMLGALKAAHAVGIVHRDLKPQNVYLVDVPGEANIVVKLLDFGIAKLLRPMEASSLTQSGSAQGALTRSGTLMGTPYYLSPEQARGDECDERTDIYSLGVMAYELFLGRLPFPDQSLAEVLGKHLYMPPPAPELLWEGIPPELGRLLLQMLEKRPEKRPNLDQIRFTLRQLSDRDLQIPKSKLVVAMTGGSDACPSEHSMERFLHQSLGPAEQDGIESHIDRCANCRALLVALSRAGEGNVQLESGEQRAISVSTATLPHAQKKRAKMRRLQGQVALAVALLGAGGAATLLLRQRAQSESKTATPQNSAAVATTGGGAADPVATESREKSALSRGVTATASGEINGGSALSTAAGPQMDASVAIVPAPPVSSKTSSSSALGRTQKTGEKRSSVPGRSTGNAATVSGPSGSSAANGGDVATSAKTPPPGDPNGGQAGSATKPNIDKTPNPWDEEDEK